MTLLTYPFNPKPGDHESVAELMANFQAIKDLVNGQLSDVNFGGTTPINISKLGTGYKPSQLGAEGATSGQGLVWDGTKWTSSNSAMKGTFSRTGVLNAISGTSETSIWSVSIPGGTLSTNNAVEVLLCGDLTYSSVQAISMQLRITYGVPEVFSQTATIAGGNANVRPWFMRFRLAGKGSTIAQSFHGDFELPGSIVTNPSSGSGDFGTTNDNDNNFMHGQAAQNSNSTLTLDIRIQFGLAGVTFNRRFAAAWVRS